MANISSDQKLLKFRDMRAMITDYSEQHGRYPTNKEFEEKLGMSEATVRRYKRVIFDEIKKNMRESFHENILMSAGKIVKKIDKSIEAFEEIRDSESSKDSDKINAAREIILAEQYKIKVMRDGIIFLEGDDNSNEIRDGEEHIHGTTSSEEQITTGISSTFG